LNSTAQLAPSFDFTTFVTTAEDLLRREQWEDVTNIFKQLAARSQESPYTFSAAYTAMCHILSTIKRLRRLNPPLAFCAPYEKWATLVNKAIAAAPPGFLKIACRDGSLAKAFERVYAEQGAPRGDWTTCMGKVWEAGLVEMPLPYPHRQPSPNDPFASAPAEVHRRLYVDDDRSPAAVSYVEGLLREMARAASTAESTYEMKLQILLRMADIFHTLYQPGSPGEAFNPRQNTFGISACHAVDAFTDEELARARAESDPQRQAGRMLANGRYWAFKAYKTPRQLWDAIKKLEGYGV
jgi:hypothetical protein